MLRRSAARIIFAGLLALAPLSLAGPLTASAADNCYYNPSKSTCDGDNPSTSGCSADSYTVETQNLDLNGEIVGTVELRYSPHCGTNWGRTTNNYYGGPFTIKAEVVRASDSRYYQYTASVTSPYTIYSAMVYARTQCAYAWGFWGDGFTHTTAQTGCH